MCTEEGNEREIEGGRERDRGREGEREGGRERWRESEREREITDCDARMELAYSLLLLTS